MLVYNKHYRTIWEKPNDNSTIQIIDQRYLPHSFIIDNLKTVKQFIYAISEMQLRGAPLIGAAAAYAMYIATLEAQKYDNYFSQIENFAEELIISRPTAINLRWAVEKQLKAIKGLSNYEDIIAAALQTARQIADDDVEQCRKIGNFGFDIIKKLSEKKQGQEINILTHCNAGWLATVDYGTATAPIYEAQKQGIKVHVWVDETRPRNQGAKLTAWELWQQSVPHTVIADNTGGHLMQHNMVDMVIVGTDRTTITGDVANKIGTYLKALAAYDNNVPFYVAVPSSSIDWTIEDGVKEIPIEQRDMDEVKYVDGLCEDKIKNVLVPPYESPAANYGFDVTPARLITGLITERGICKPEKEGILRLFPEKR